MLKLGEAITRKRKLILVVAVLLLIPSVLGMIATRINYDVLSYLPDDIQTTKGQDILLDDFGKGGFAMVMVDGMNQKDVSALKSKFEDVDHVDSVIWYDSIVDSSVPLEMVPGDVYKKFNSGDTTLMAVFFDEGTSADGSLKAVAKIRQIGGKQCFVSSMTAFVEDLKELAEKEEPIYVGLAVLLCCIILAIFMDSWMIPVVFMAGIGMAILYNLGSNFFLGQVSYITKALSAVLQLGVTMDYSIFLYHRYEEERANYEDKRDAMAKAIVAAFTSQSGSSLTTIAGFIALCFMSFTLGLDMGIVMAKGVLLGVICCVTVLPSLILVFDKAIWKTAHRTFQLPTGGISDFVAKHYKFFAILMVLLWIPDLYVNSNYYVYYKLDNSLKD